MSQIFLPEDDHWCTLAFYLSCRGYRLQSDSSRATHRSVSPEPGSLFEKGFTSCIKDDNLTIYALPDPVSAIRSPKSGKVGEKSLSGSH